MSESPLMPPATGGHYEPSRQVNYWPCDNTIPGNALCWSCHFCIANERAIRLRHSVCQGSVASSARTFAASSEASWSRRA